MTLQTASDARRPLLLLPRAPAAGPRSALAGSRHGLEGSRAPAAPAAPAGSAQLQHALLLLHSVRAGLGPAVSLGRPAAQNDGTATAGRRQNSRLRPPLLDPARVRRAASKPPPPHSGLHTQGCTSSCERRESKKCSWDATNRSWSLETKRRKERKKKKLKRTLKGSRRRNALPGRRAGVLERSGQMRRVDGAACARPRPSAHAASPARGLTRQLTQPRPAPSTRPAVCPAAA